MSGYVEHKDVDAVERRWYMESKRWDGMPK